jgi:hypothetical protein
MLGRLELLPFCIEYCHRFNDHYTGFALDCRHSGDLEEKGRVPQYISIKNLVRALFYPFLLNGK